jgi:hypothetical protein
MRSSRSVWCCFSSVSSRASRSSRQASSDAWTRLAYLLLQLLAGQATPLAQLRRELIASLARLRIQALAQVLQVPDPAGVHLRELRG